MTVVVATKPLTWEEFANLPAGQVVHLESRTNHVKPFNAMILGPAVEALDLTAYQETPSGIAVRIDGDMGAMVFTKDKGAQPGGILERSHVEEWYEVTTTETHVYKHTLEHKVRIVMSWMLEGGTIRNTDGHVLALSEDYELVAEGERLQLGKGADQKPEKVYLNTFASLGAFIKIVEKLPDEDVSLYAAQTVITRQNGR